jgi:hypothetical protein
VVPNFVYPLGSVITMYVHVIYDCSNITMVVVGMDFGRFVQLFCLFMEQTGVLGVIGATHVVATLAQDDAIPK